MSLLDKILTGAGGAVALALLTALAWLAFANAHLKTQLAQTRSYATACELANDQFGDLVGRQNRLVAALQQAGDARARAARTAMAAADRRAASFRRDAARLNATPSHGGDCRAADRLLADFIAGKP